MSKQEQLQLLLDELKAALPELKDIIVASADGLPVAVLGESEIATRLAAMAATAHGLGKRIASTTQLGDLVEIVIRGSQAFFIAYAIGDKGILGLTTPAGSNLGLVRLEAQEVAKKLAAVL